jgi:CspA family cold shock protein
MSSNQTTGTVKFFDTKKSFGFIGSDDITGDLFVHYRSIMVEGFKNFGRDSRCPSPQFGATKGWQAHEVIPLGSNCRCW